ncbi:MAG: hypothetical protein GXP38_17330 [Chloroflexi bacterium]|nr:hypothetical protein [Chloroflexota bacterium]
MTESQQPTKQVINELNKMGKKFGEALRTVLSSPQRQEIEEEVREGFQTVVSEINEALAKARTTDVAKDVSQQAEKVVETVKSSKVTADLRQGLLKGLKTLNAELDELLERLQEGEEEVSSPAETAETTAEEE